MKTKIIYLAVISLLLTGCAVTQQAPMPDDIGIYERGSFIKVIMLSASKIDGELIAVSDTTVIVLDSVSQKVVTLPINSIYDFSLYYAKNENYGYLVPYYSLATCTHGFFLIFTLPINLITSIVTATNARAAYRYTKDEISYNDLKMFARYPQGIPPHIPLESIQYRGD